MWPHRLAVRTPDSHSGDTGSIPVGAAKIKTPRMRCFLVFTDWWKNVIIITNIRAFCALKTHIRYGILGNPDTGECEYEKS